MELTREMSPTITDRFDSKSFLSLSSETRVPAPPMPLLRSTICPPPRGFSLVEILAVITLIGILVGIGSVSMMGYAKASRLATASLQCANLLESARDTAILRKNPVAVAMFPADSEAPAALTAFEYQAFSHTWQRISGWEKLPTGIVFDPDFNSDANSALAKNSPTVSPPLPAMDHAGTSYSPGGPNGYAFLVFLPSGVLLQQHSHPGLLRFVAGFRENQSIHRTGPPGHFVDLVIIPSTGRIKIVQPE